MANFFSHIEYTYISHKIEYKPHAAVLYPKAFAKVWHYQQPGTLSMFNITTKAIDDNAERKHVEAKIRFDYVYLMLGLQQLPSLERAASYALSAPIEKRVLEMQHEMLSTQSSFDKREVEAPEKLEPSVLSQFLSLG